MEKRSLKALSAEERRALIGLMKMLAGDTAPIITDKQTLQRMIDEVQRADEIEVNDLGRISLLIDRACNKIKIRLGLRNICSSYAGEAGEK